MNAIDFDDLLFLAYKIFMANPNIASLYRRNFEYICIDEAQDMNKAQYVFLRALSGENKNVMLVGDPKQSIYRFRGAQPAVYFSTKEKMEKLAAYQEFFKKMDGAIQRYEAARKDHPLSREDLLHGVEREYQKMGKVFIAPR